MPEQYKNAWKPHQKTTGILAFFGFSITDKPYSRHKRSDTSLNLSFMLPLTCHRLVTAISDRPSEKKILCPCTSVLDSFFPDFWINEKAAAPHREWQECFLLLGFAMLCNGFGIQNYAAIHQPKRTTYVRRQSALSIGWHFILPSMCYFIFNLPIPSRVFQNIIAAASMSRF